jgi:type VI secretion system secreted protein VgrG
MAWAGKQWGGIFLPRIGQEVIVSYLEGDPDCPFNYRRGLQQRASRALHTARRTNEEHVKTELVEKAATASTRFVSRTRKTRKRSTSTRKRIRTSWSARPHQEVLNNETNTIEGTRESTITGDETNTNKANFNQKVTGNYELKVTGNLTIDVTGQVMIKSAAGTNVESSAITVIKGSMVKIN